jgi:hypothetical protein
MRLFHNCLVIVAVAGCATQAPNTFTGHVVDQPTGRAIPHASVLWLDGPESIVESSTQLAIANECGRFILPAMRNGIYRLRFSMLGWRSKDYAVTIDSLRRDSLRIALERVEGFEIHGQPIRYDDLPKPC